ncbi:MAG: hypothetical protein IJV40_11240 [Oscillospiraceae bacterium]|nr:hypothetical protein [Oscillospiraceae bacterium]
MEMEEYRSGKKSLELACYIGGAGAFGVFLRWMQHQLAFNELGLPEKSLFHPLLLLYVLAAAGVFLYFIHRFEQQRLYLPDEFPAAFSNTGRWYVIARIATGLIVCAGAALLYLQTDTDRNSADYQLLSILAIVAGISFPLWLGFANRDPQPNIWLLCALSFFLMFFLAAWMVICYKINTINSVIWSYGPELVAVAASMFAFFRMGGFLFGRPKWTHCLFTCMFAAALCIVCLADERYLGMQIIFLGLAAEQLLVCWIMVKNLQKGAAPQKKKKSTGGFESLT